MTLIYEEKCGNFLTEHISSSWKAEHQYIYPTSLTSQTFPSPNSLNVIRLLRQKVSGTELKNSMKLKESLCDTSSSEPYRIASINTPEMTSLYTEGAPHSQKNEPI